MVKIRTVSDHVAKLFLLTMMCGITVTSIGCSMFDIDNDPLRNHSYMKEEVGYFPQSGKFRTLKEAEATSNARVETKNNLMTPVQ